MVEHLQGAEFVQGSHSPHRKPTALGQVECLPERTTRLGWVVIAMGAAGQFVGVTAHIRSGVDRGEGRGGGVERQRAVAIGDGQLGSQDLATRK